jgi:hypothetical protein
MMKEQVLAACADLARYQVREQEDAEVLFQQPPKTSTGLPPATPPEAMAFLREMKAKHYQAWVDTPVPALQGQTPRQAVAKPNGRREVLLLLKQQEHREGRLPEEERVDFAHVYQELGLAPG